MSQLEANKIKMESNIEYKKMVANDIAEKLKEKNETDKKRVESIERKATEKRKRVEERQKEQEEAQKLIKEI